MKLRLRLLVAVPLALVLGGCGGGSDDVDSADPAAGVDGPNVVLRDIAFKPGTIKVQAGATVTWIFDDRGIPHNVVADDKSFESETMDDGRFTHTFEKAGDYPYVCTLHPIMKGTVQVGP